MLHGHVASSAEQALGSSHRVSENIIRANSQRPPNLRNIELGFLFSPMGLNLFLSAQRFQKPLPYIYTRALPFLIIMAVGVLAITYLPVLTTGVVSLVKD
jgi:hypothetical protein